MKNQADADSPGAGESMQSKTERDYILGTNDEEVIRLGSQHRVWRPVVSKLWWKAGITVRKRVLDLGAGPGMPQSIWRRSLDQRAKSSLLNARANLSA